MNGSLTKRLPLILCVLMVALLCSSCGGGSKGGSTGGEGTPVSQDPTVCVTPIASQPTGIYPFIDSTITVANGATLFRYAGVDGNANPLWVKEQSPFRINNEGQYEFKATMT
ncbi:MAG TPA: hypothetical protein VHR47_02645, partial [Bacillota bacterium]|nr:hypothetical protein [Bacillota bacterium]